MRLSVSIALVVLLPSLSWAVDTHDFLNVNGTAAVALTGGDTPNTYSVSVASAVAPGAATLLRPAVSDRSRRKVCFQNRGSVTVSIGSSTLVASNFYILGEATSTLNSNNYCTNGSGAYYAAALANAAAQTVVVIEEKQSIP